MAAEERRLVAAAPLAAGQVGAEAGR